MLNKIVYFKEKIESYYGAFGVRINLTMVQIHDECHRLIYKVRMLPGVKSKAIYDYAKDIKLALELPFFIPYEEDGAIFIAVSEEEIVENSLLKIISSNQFKDAEMEIPLAIGYNYLGKKYITDLAKLIHLVIAGPSGTGKSMALKCAIISMITRCGVEKLRLILFDIGGNSLTFFKDVKHLYHPIVKDYRTGLQVLEALVAEIDSRALVSEDRCKMLPYLVCIIDEFDDTIANICDKSEKDRFQSLLRNIVNRGRKAKVIVIITSLDPNQNRADININGIGSRITFQYLKHQKSMNAIGMPGAENLSGDGALIFRPKGKNELITLQGSYIDDDELMNLLEDAPEGCENLPMLEICEQSGDFFEEPEIVYDESKNKELAKIVLYTLGNETMSSNKLQKTFRVGANHANGMIDSLYKMGLVVEKYANQPRKVLPQCIEDLSEEVIGFLEKHGYSKEQLENIFEMKKANMPCSFVDSLIE